MFADELERIDRAMHSKKGLWRPRVRAYYEFRDRSEPVERLHPMASRRAWPLSEWPSVSEECAVCGQKFWSRKEYRRHTRTHRTPLAQSTYVATAPVAQTPAQVEPAGIAVGTCLVCGVLRFKFADSTPPENCKHCGSGHIEHGALAGRVA